MDFVQIIYEDPGTNEVQEKSDLTPILLGSSDVKYGAALGTDLVMHTEEATPSGQETNIVKDPAKNLAVGEWTNRETNYLLKKYNKYIAMTGVRKRFRTKRDMWYRIAQDMKNDLNVLRTSGQCENRYKTVLRKWRKHNMAKQETSFVDVAEAEAEAEGEQLPGPSLVASKLVQNNVDESCDELSNSNDQEGEAESEKDLAKVLWDIFKKKEEGRERRHKEKMELINKIMSQFYQ